MERKAKTLVAYLAGGYESETQFRREDRRVFGEPPHRDNSRRSKAAGHAAWGSNRPDFINREA